MKFDAYWSECAIYKYNIKNIKWFYNLFIFMIFFLIIIFTICILKDYKENKR